MTQITVTFDEKFDLENGELKYITHDFGNYIEYGLNDAYDVNELGTIDNTGNVTILTINNLDYYPSGIQFVYVISDELIKSTKDIPLEYLSNHHTSGVSINISDVEKFMIYIDYYNDGLQAAYDENDNERTDAFNIMLLLQMVTVLAGHDDAYDFDFSGIVMKLTFYDSNDDYVCEKTISFDDMEENGTYIMDTTNTNLDTEEYYQYQVEVEILNPNVISDIGRLQDMS